MREDAAARMAAAVAAHEAGRLDEAERAYLALLRDGGDDAALLRQLGVLRLQQGQVAGALAATRRALELEPQSAEGHANLATALHMAGDDTASVAGYERALALDPGRAESHYGLGCALLARSPEEARACFARAAVIDPDYAEAHCALGAACVALERYEEALAPLARALALDPDYVEAHRGRAAALQGLRRPAEAAAHYERAASLAPAHVPTWLALGAVQHTLGRHTAALEAYRSALAADADCVAAYTGLGAVLQELGRMDEARRSYTAALEREPHDVRALCALLAMQPVAAGDAHLATLESLTAGPAARSDEERIMMSFALGTALAESGAPQRAFEQLVRGNRLRRRQLVYDEAATLRMLERIPEIFTAALMQAKSGGGDQSTLPIFIVGMPRSGSTLVEQVLASLPGVFGAGERPDFNNALRQAGLDEPSQPYPQAVPALSAEQLRRLAADYLGSLRASAPAALRITDKMLMNFCLVGLIHLGLPRARIIHIRRDPVDTCLSCFATYFEQVPYAFDLGELGRYYRAYARTMQHWRRVLPAGVMLDVRYEALVRNFEPEVRRMLDHCGLAWDEACRSFYATARPVGTASKHQVRRPLFHSSIGRWRPPAEVLQPLLEPLAEIGEDLADGDAGRSAP
jgi:tetratricopeptide (TPR) repeat protein